MKKVQIGSILYDVISAEEYDRDPNLYASSYTAIESNGHVYPIVNGTQYKQVGFYPQVSTMCGYIVKSDEQQYSADNIIDYNKASDIRELISTNERVRKIEDEMLTTKDNVTKLNISPDCTPEMVALKQAINLKSIDIDKYKNRFEQFQNDFRILKGDSITLGKLISTCKSLDIEADLILRDKPECANPMNTEIRVDLTVRGDDK